MSKSTQLAVALSPGSPFVAGSTIENRPLPSFKQQRVARLRRGEHVRLPLPSKSATDELAIDEPVLVRRALELRVVGPRELASADEFARKRLAAVVAIEVEAVVLVRQQIDIPVVVRVEPDEIDDLVVGQVETDVGGDVDEPLVGVCR